MGLNPESQIFSKENFYDVEKYSTKKIALICAIFFNEFLMVNPYFCRYITSFTNFTVLGTSGKAAVTKFGA